MHIYKMYPTHARLIFYSRRTNLYGYISDLFIQAQEFQSNVKVIVSINKDKTLLIDFCVFVL